MRWVHRPVSAALATALVGGAIATSNISVAAVSNAVPAPGETWSESQAAAHGATRTIIEHDSGAEEYVYSLPGVQSALHIFRPPAAWRPLTATSAELQLYGFPPRPTSQPDLDGWIDAMKSYQRPPVPVLTIATKAPQRAQSAQSFATTTQQSSNWSGYVDQPTHGTYISAKTSTQVPTLQTGCASNAITDNWVGLGGFNTSSLIQDGIGFNDPQQGAWSAWYEVISPSQNIGPLVISNSAIALNQGDNVFMYVNYQRGTQIASFYVSDTTTGQVSQFQKTNLDASFYDGGAADFITEKTGADLKKFAANNWWNAYAQTTDGTWWTVGANNNYQLNAWNFVQNHKIAGPGALNADQRSWTEYWDSCN